MGKPGAEKSETQSSGGFRDSPEMARPIICREEFHSIRELRDGSDRFLGWYNRIRLHSALGSACLWAKLLETAKAHNAA